jgi:hypothetical protein
MELRHKVLYRHIIAGIVEPPPLLVAEIYDWARGYLAVNEILGNKKWLQHLRETLVEYKDDDDSPLSEKNLNRDIEKAKQIIQDALVVIKETKPPIKAWRKVTKKFKVTPLLVGWKYEHLAGTELFDTITVELINGIGNFAGEWDRTKSKLKLTTGLRNDPERLHQTLSHELVHWAQYYLGKTTFGKPPKRMRDPDISQRQKGEGFHSRDDTEFYPELLDLVRNIKKQLQELGSQNNKNLVIRSLLGVGEVVPGFKPSKFVLDLKAGSPRKWQKMVGEVYKLL